METQEFEAVLDAVRRLIREHFIPREEEIEANDEVPQDLRQRAIDMGLFGYTIPEEYGGMGMSVVEDARLTMEFGYTVPAFRSMFGTNVGLAGKVLVNYGTDVQKKTWLPRLAAGQIASFGLTEPEAGSDPSGMRTRAERMSDGSFEITGSKRFITNAPIADVFMIFARTGTGPKPTDGISCFIVEAGTDGLSIGPKDAKTGQAGAWTAEIFLDRVRVPETALVGELDTGFGTAMRSLAMGRIHLGAMSVGMARRMLDESIFHAQSNKQGGAPIGRFQLVQALLAESKAELFAAEAMVMEAARRYDSGEDTKLGPSSVKLFCSEMVCRAADRAVQVHGGLGYMRATPVERFSRAARIMPIYEGTTEIQKLIIGRALLRHGDSRRSDLRARPMVASA